MTNNWLICEVCGIIDPATSGVKTQNAPHFQKQFGRRILVSQTRRDMTATRDFEKERAELLRQIDAALPPEVRMALQAASQLPQEAKAVLPKNEVGSEYADER